MLSEQVSAFSRMALYFYGLVVIYLPFSVFFCCAFTKDIKVLLTNDAPTTIGGNTTLSAVVLNCSGIQYRYCWYRPQEYCQQIKGPKASLVIGNWSSSGPKIVSLLVERMTPNYKCCGNNSTKFLVTDTINAQLKVSPHDKKYLVGPVNMSVHVHDPSHLFDPNMIIYHWNFNDSSKPVENNLNTMIHNFTENRVYNVSVLITAHALGKLYNGTVSKTLPFEVDFSPALHVYNLHNGTSSRMLRLAPPTKDRIFVALGQVEFIIVYDNPYSLIKNLSTGWNFHNGPSIPHKPGNKIIHNYSSLGETHVWATPTFITQNGKSQSHTLGQAITVEEPVSEFNMTSNSSCTAIGDLLVNVTCQGSKPFQLCWKLFKTSHRPLFDNCSSLSQTCNFQINYTIPYSGAFTLDIFVMNYVSAVNYIHHFSIPEPTAKPHPNTGAKTASAIVPVIICVIIIIIVLVFVAKKVYSSRHHSVLETADFDFRDEDSRSLDSYLVENQCCYSFTFCRRFSRKKENIPLLDDWGAKSYATMYSDIL